MTGENGQNFLRLVDTTDSKSEPGLNDSLDFQQQLLEDIKNYQSKQNNYSKNQLNELNVNIATYSPQTTSPIVSNFPSGQCSPRDSSNYLGPRSFTNTDNFLLKAYQNDTHNDRFVNKCNLPDNLSFANEKSYDGFDNQSYTNLKINTPQNKKTEQTEERKTTVCCVCNNNITR